MKKVRIVLSASFIVLAVSFGFVLGSVSTAFSAENKSTVKDSKMTFAVKGMTCDMCEGTIEKKVSAIPGVASAKADHAAKNLVVEVAPGATVSPEAIKKAVSAAGYEAN